MKKAIAVLLVPVVLASCPVFAQENQDLIDIGKIIDAKMVFALAEGSDKFCPNLTIGDNELVARYVQGVINEKGEINAEWMHSIGRQSIKLNSNIRSVIGLPGKEKIGSFEVHYDSGITRIILVSREGKVECKRHDEVDSK